MHTAIKSNHKNQLCKRANVQQLCRNKVAQLKPAPVKGFKICSTVQKKAAHCTAETRANSGSQLCRISLIYKAGLHTHAASQIL